MTRFILAMLASLVTILMVPPVILHFASGLVLLPLDAARRYLSQAAERK